MKGYNIDEIEFEDDSNLTTPELLTGEYLTSIGKNIQPNAEVEGGEYVQFPDKETQKVAGKDHEQGGVPVNIPDGTKVLSKSLNLSKQQAKMLKDVFDIELTTKDNYSAALDKYTKKIGLKKLNDEQEEIFRTLEKTLDKTKDPKTLKLNKAFISEKIQEIENKKEPLEKQRSQFFDTLFELQEKSKADKGDEDAKFRYGGIQKAKFDAIATKLGLDPEQAAIMLKAKREGTLPKYEEGGIKDELPPYVEANAYTPQGIRRLNTYRQKSGLAPIPETSSKEAVKKAVLEMQNKVAKEHPDLVYQYMLDESHQPNNKLLSKLPKEYEQSNAGLKKAVEDGKLKKEDVIDAYQDGLWWYRAVDPTTPAVLPPPPKTTTTTPPDETVIPPPAGAPKPKGTGTRIVDTVTETPKKEYARAFYMPDQSVMPPTPPEGHLKTNIRLDRIDPLRIGIDQTIQDTTDQRNFVLNQLDSLPEAQRAAITANLLANSQKTVADAATKANMANAQNYSQAELFNIQQRGQEQMFDAQNALDFERRQFTANAKYDESLRNYFDYNRKVNTTNFQNQQKLNLIDSLFPDYDLDYMGATVSYNPKSEWKPVVAGLGNTGEEMTKEELEAERKRSQIELARTQAEKNRIQNNRNSLLGFLFS